MQRKLSNEGLCLYHINTALTLLGPRFFRYRKDRGGDFSFESARPKKGFKIWPFSKMYKPKSSFLTIFQKFLQKLPFLPYFDTQHLIYEILIFLLFFVGGPGGYQKSKNIFIKLWFVRWFFIKANKKKIYKWCHKSAVRGCKLNFLEKNFIGLSAIGRNPTPTVSCPFLIFFLQKFSLYPLTALLGDPVQI